MKHWRCCFTWKRLVDHHVYQQRQVAVVPFTNGVTFDLWWFKIHVWKLLPEFRD